MRPLLACALLLAATASGCGEPDTSNADETAPGASSTGRGPTTRPGLWEISTMSPLGFGETVTVCTDDALEEDRSNLEPPALEGCTTTRQPAPGGFRQEHRCQGPGVPPSSIAVTFAGDEEAFEIATLVSLGEEASIASSRKARRLGGCPANVQPGDIVARTEIEPQG